MRFKVRAFRETFGDETNPSYDTARKQHYSQGAPRDWQANFVSAYASMHPWEDFAETFGVYLDMAAVLSTSNHFGLSSCEIKEFDTMVRAYLHVGIAANELNRDMGLLDLVPEVFTPSVIAKLRFIHGLRRTKC